MHGQVFGWLLELVSLRKQRTAPLLRTTTAVTIIKAGEKARGVSLCAFGSVPARWHRHDGPCPCPSDRPLCRHRNAANVRRVTCAVLTDGSALCLFCSGRR
jgi:hypothetical protein